MHTEREGWLLTPYFISLRGGQFIQTFFVSALSGSITAELYNFLEAPEMVISLLANSLPAQSSYFIQVRTSALENFVYPAQNLTSVLDLFCFYIPYARIRPVARLSTRNGILASVCVRAPINREGEEDDMEYVQLSGRSPGLLACGIAFPNHDLLCRLLCVCHTVTDHERVPVLLLFHLRERLSVPLRSQRQAYEGQRWKAVARIHSCPHGEYVDGAAHAFWYANPEKDRLRNCSPCTTWCDYAAVYDLHGSQAESCCDTSANTQVRRD